MKTKAYAAVACAAVLVALAVAPAEAEPKTKASANPPRARIVVEPRSFLDAGTEVLPGERKFTDYAFPPGPYSTPLAVVTNTGGRVGWHRSPLPGPFDLPSRNNPFGW
jgi:hypothetical protein